MISPAEELATYHADQSTPPARCEPDAQDGAPGYGPDEERLVARAREEAILRLARAL